MNQRVKIQKRSNLGDKREYHALSQSKDPQKKDKSIQIHENWVTIFQTSAKKKAAWNVRCKCRTILEIGQYLKSFGRKENFKILSKFVLGTLEPKLWQEMERLVCLPQVVLKWIAIAPICSLLSRVLKVQFWKIFRGSGPFQKWKIWRWILKTHSSDKFYSLFIFGSTRPWYSSDSVHLKSIAFKPGRIRG